MEILFIIVLQDKVSSINLIGHALNEEHIKTLPKDILKVLIKCKDYPGGGYIIIKISVVPK